MSRQAVSRSLGPLRKLAGAVSSFLKENTAANSRAITEPNVRQLASAVKDVYEQVGNYRASPLPSSYVKEFCRLHLPENLLDLLAVLLHLVSNHFKTGLAVDWVGGTWYTAGSILACLLWSAKGMKEPAAAELLLDQLVPLSTVTAQSGECSNGVQVFPCAPTAWPLNIVSVRLEVTEILPVHGADQVFNIMTRPSSGFSLAPLFLVYDNGYLHCKDST